MQNSSTSNERTSALIKTSSTTLLSKAKHRTRSKRNSCNRNQSASLSCTGRPLSASDKQKTYDL